MISIDFGQKGTINITLPVAGCSRVFYDSDGHLIDPTHDPQAVVWETASYKLFTDARFFELLLSAAIDAYDPDLLVVDVFPPPSRPLSLAVTGNKSTARSKLSPRDASRVVAAFSQIGSRERWTVVGIPSVDASSWLSRKSLDFADCLRDRGDSWFAITIDLDGIGLAYFIFDEHYKTFAHIMEQNRKLESLDNPRSRERE